MASGRPYTVVFTGVAVTVSQDFFEITPADDKPCVPLALYLSQYSDFKDAEDELLSYSVIRGFTTSGSGGSAPTPRPLNRSDAAAGFAAEVNNTTKATTGTTHTLHQDSFNVRTGLVLIFTPEMQASFSQADTTLVVRLDVAPVDSLTMNGTLYLLEMG
jgi:hypothetical protein